LETKIGRIGDFFCLKPANAEVWSATKAVHGKAKQKGSNFFSSYILHLFYQVVLENV
jgi:hypothetical protein